MYTRQQIDQLWEMAKSDSLRDSREYRKDFAGAWIRKDMFGYQSQYGWTVCRKLPRARGGSDDESNLMPVHWRNNRFKGTDYPYFRSVITSSGTRNIIKIQTWEVR